VTGLHFWLADWEHECCGDRRKVGDEITVALTFVGALEPIEDYESVLALDDGEMLIAGEVEAGSYGCVVRSGAVRFGVRDELAVSERVRCQGRLWEVRHEIEGSDVTTGRVTGIRWRPALLDDEWRVVGYEAGPVIYNTDTRPEKPRMMSFGPVSVPLPPSAAELRTRRAWAFVFTIEVSEPSDLS
jgi:hypothetical protein